MHINWPGGREVAISLIILLGLSVPFLPVPGDYMTRMEVRFYARGMATPHAFTARTLHNICTVMAAALAYEDPQTGQYTRITCED
jgi:hypothetical protein